MECQIRMDLWGLWSLISLKSALVSVQQKPVARMVPNLPLQRKLRVMSTVETKPYN